jgi:hypothetical protein
MFVRSAAMALAVALSSVMPTAVLAAPSGGPDTRSWTAPADMTPTGFDVIATVTTKNTGCDGKRDSKWSRQETIPAPAGYYINKNRVQVHWLNAIGSENKEELIYSNEISISSEDPDLVFPTVLQYRVFARSSKGLCAPAGRSEIRIVGKFSRVLG